jgi:hypothetical protein
VSLVIHHLAVQMQFVLREMEQEHVHVCQNISEIHTLVVDLSVSKTVIVIDRKLASTTNVKIHVLACVELMLNVEFKITHLSVSALLDTKVIRCEDVN